MIAETVTRRHVLKWTFMLTTPTLLCITFYGHQEVALAERYGNIDSSRIPGG